MTRWTVLSLALVPLLTVPAVAPAQPTPAATTWTRGTTLGLFAGMAADSTGAGASVGGAVGWEFTPRFGIEGSGAWLDRPQVDAAFAAALTAHANLVRPRSIVPFVRGGVGLYRAAFDSARDEIPAFYRRRLEAEGTGPGGSRTFTDPSLVVGVGVNVFASRNWAIRPEVEAIVVRREGRGHGVIAAGLRAIYHFEAHPITPLLRRR